MGQDIQLENGNLCSISGNRGKREKDSEDAPDTPAHDMSGWLEFHIRKHATATGELHIGVEEIQGIRYAQDSHILC